MAPLPFLADPKEKNKKKKTQKQKQKQNSSFSSWNQIKNILSCKQMEGSRLLVHDPSKVTSNHSYGSSSLSICKFSDVIQGNARVGHRSDHSPESSNLGQETGLLTRRSSSMVTSSSKAIHFRKLSGCYECHMIVDPTRYPISPRLCACSECGEVFPRLESLELHQAIRHAVSELGAQDSGRNIVEIIFKSSWLEKDKPLYKMERILKVHNTQRTIQRFEDARDTVKSRALVSTRKEPRSTVDGNELLRFHCTTISCSLGSRGSTSLCSALPACRVCTIIRHGFHTKTLRLGNETKEVKGVRTTASSGRAHDVLRCFDQRRAMLVCRVIAGRVRRMHSDPKEEDERVYDSVAAGDTNLDDLVVFNPRAILPCFVVIYKCYDS